MPFIGALDGEEGVRVLSIALDNVDFGAGNLAGPPCSVVGRTGVFVTITGLLFAFFLLLDGVEFFFAGIAFFPNLTDAGRGLIFFTTGFAAAVAAFFFVVLVALTCVTFPAGLVVFEFAFEGASDSPITGTVTKPTAAITAHFIQLFMATPLPKPI